MALQKKTKARQVCAKVSIRSWHSCLNEYFGSKIEKRAQSEFNQPYLPSMASHSETYLHIVSSDRFRGAGALKKISLGRNTGPSGSASTHAAPELLKQKIVDTQKHIFPIQMTNEIPRRIKKCSSHLRKREKTLNNYFLILEWPFKIYSNHS